MTRNAFINGLTAFIVGTVIQGQVSAADVLPEAKARAALYRSEARKFLERDNWAVTRDRPGEFTAVHRAFPDQGAHFSGVAMYGPQTRVSVAPVIVHLTVKFRPVSAVDTECFANMVGYITHTNAKTGKPFVTGPFNVASPTFTKDVKVLIAKAEKQLVREHPEYMPGGLAR